MRDKKVHFQVIREVIDFATSNGFALLGLSYSPIKGPEGNIEYLAYLKKSSDAPEITDEEILEAVEKSHMSLDK